MQMMTRLQEARSLDVISDKLQAAVQAVAKPQRLRDLLHGTWLGHPLHPVLVRCRSAHSCRRLSWTCCPVGAGRRPP